MIRIAVMVSGTGSNLKALLDAQSANELIHGKVTLVLSDTQCAPALEKAHAYGISAFAIDRRALGKKQFEESALAILARHGIDLIVLAGFLTILSERFISSYENRIINIHPSLIPSFCGKGYYGRRVHEAVINKGVKYSGATVHLASAQADEGPILEQGIVRISADDTPDSLAKRILEEVEWNILPKAVEEYCKKMKEKHELKHVLAQIRYPGRGIVCGLNEKGNLLLAYFITARSVHSKNRMLVQKDGAVFTQAIDPSLLIDPSLIIYRALDRYEQYLIAANGDQSDTLIEGLKTELSVEDSLSERCYEPDEPNYTPRISAVYSLKDEQCTFSILRRSTEGCERCHYCYQNQESGQGHLIHTYEGDGNPLPSFIGDPKPVVMEGDRESFATRLWDLLDPEYRVAVVVQEMQRDGQNVGTTIINAQERRD